MAVGVGMINRIVEQPAVGNLGGERGQTGGFSEARYGLSRMAFDGSDRHLPLVGQPLVKMVDQAAKLVYRNDLGILGVDVAPHMLHKVVNVPWLFLNLRFAGGRLLLSMRRHRKDRGPTS